MIENKMGRPIKGDEPRDKRLSLRISESEMNEIDNLAKKLGKTKIDTVMEAIMLLKNSL